MDEEPLTQGRVLVAEDVESFALLITTILRNRGYTVALAKDGEECLAVAKSFRPHLIILDLMMPKIHGMEVLRQIKTNPDTQRIGVIMCTAKRFKTDFDQAMELGCFEVLFKPFDKEQLLDVVGRFFSGATGLNTQIITAAPREVYLPAIPQDRCYCRFWGTRGSIPVSAPRYARHGGNTSCIEVGFGSETIIVDAGSGIRELSSHLAKKGPGRYHILITHTHWDHIQGFPFFTPAYLPGTELIIYGVTGFKKDLSAVFRGQLDSDYFPVQFEDMRAKIEFRPLPPVLEIAGFKVTWEYTHHPAATVGFRFERNGKSLAYVSDNEFLYGYLGKPHGLTLASETVAPHLKIVEFVAGADLLVAEAQYTSEEYRTKVGWGHSSLSNACALAFLSKARRWLVTHHDPYHDDEFLDRKLNLTREILASLQHPVDVRHAYDGLTEYW